MKKLYVTKNEKTFRDNLARLSRKKDADAYYIRQILGYANKKNEFMGSEEIKATFKHAVYKCGEGFSKEYYYIEGLPIGVSFAKQDRFNQVILQLDSYNRICASGYEDYINPILRVSTHQGDKLSPDENRYIDKCFIISFNAIIIKNVNIIDIFRKCCKMNDVDMDIEATAQKDCEKFFDFIDHFNIKDIKADNIGIIFDYSKNKYKVVLIDYAL